MSKKRLILHIGTHKTGTTTIQSTLFNLQHILRKRGIVYPNANLYSSSQKAHHFFAHAVAEAYQWHYLTAINFISALKKDSNQIVLLSSEAIYRHTLNKNSRSYWKRRQAYIKRLSELVEEFDVELLIFFRRRDRFIESVYHERVYKGDTETFYKTLEKKKPALDYGKQVSLLNSHFRLVKIYSYENAIKYGLINTFLNAIDCGDILHAEDKHVWERISSDARVTLWMAEKNRLDLKDLSKRQLFSKSKAIKKLFKDHGKLTLWPGNKLRSEFLSAYYDFNPISDNRTSVTYTDNERSLLDKAYQEYLRACQDK